MRPLLRWGLGTLLALLLTVFLSLAAVLWLPSGTRFALNFTASLLPQLEIDGVNGTLASDLSIDRLSFRQGELGIDVTRLRLRWHAWSLTQPLLKIQELGAAGLNIRLPETTEPQELAEPASAPGLPELPAIELPLAIEVDRFALESIQVVQGEQRLLDELNLVLALHTQERLLIIEPLQLEQPGSSLILNGWVEPSRHFLTHLELQGGTDLTRWLQMPHWPESLLLNADLVVDFDGVARTATLALTARQDNTRLSLQAQVKGSDELAVAYQVSAQGINPALAAPDWPGNLGLEASGELVLGAELPHLALEVSSLQGLLKQQPVSGRASLSGDTRQWQIDVLNLRYAGAEVRANGAVSDRLALEWGVSAPALARLLPQARGRLELSGQLTGPLRQPSLQARIRAEQLGYADQASLEQLRGDIALDLSGQSDWATGLELTGAEAAGQRIDQASLQLNGTPELHRLTLAANGSPGRIELAATGGWTASEQNWQGQLQMLELKPHALSHWRSSAAAALSVSPQGYQMERFCLDEISAGGQLCVQADGSFSGRTRAQVALDRLSLGLLTPLLNGMQLTPELSADIAFTQQPGGLPTLNATLNTSAGELTPAQSDQTLSLSPAEVRVALAEDNLKLQADTQLEFLAGELKLALDVRGLSGEQRLQGELTLQADNLSLISVLAPDLQNMSGQVGGQLTLGGTVAQPELAGELNYLNGGMELPALGLVIAPLEFRLNQSGLPGRVRFSAEATSGEGQLLLAGDYDLAQRQGALSLNGENFTAMDTAEIRALISPDLKLQLSAREMRLEGLLQVPYAHVSPPKARESAVQPSADVVRVEQGEVVAKEPVVPVYADLRIELGDDVRVDALGFKGRLLGALQVEETPGQTTRATGSIQVESGEYRLYGQDLEIRRGSLVYAAGPVDNPGLDLRIGREIEDVVVGANVSGTLRDPRMDLYGEPAMPDSSVLSYLLLGKAPGENSAGEQQMMMQAALALGMSQGNRITGKLRESLALDEFGFDSDANDESAFFIGKYLSPRLYLRYGIGVLDAVNTLSLKYKLTEKWRLEAQSSELGSGGDILYTLER